MSKKKAKEDKKIALDWRVQSKDVTKTKEALVRASVVARARRRIDTSKAKETKKQ